MNARDFFFGAAWLLLAGFGFSSLWSYASAPGVAASAPTSWPLGTCVARDPDRATLVMLAHPRCPCTRASLRELDLLMAQCAGELSAHVVFYRPAD